MLPDYRQHKSRRNGGSGTPKLVFLRLLVREILLVAPHPTPPHPTPPLDHGLGFGVGWGANPSLASEWLGSSLGIGGLGLGLGFRV